MTGGSDCLWLGMWAGWCHLCTGNWQNWNFSSTIKGHFKIFQPLSRKVSSAGTAISDCESIKSKMEQAAHRQTAAKVTTGTNRFASPRTFQAQSLNFQCRSVKNRKGKRRRPEMTRRASSPCSHKAAEMKKNESFCRTCGLNHNKVCPLMNWRKQSFFFWLPFFFHYD